MMLNKDLLDSTVALHLDLERVSAGVRRDIVAMLKTLEKELTAKVATTDWSKARIARQIKEAQAIIADVYEQAAGTAQEATLTAAQVTASSTVGALTVAVGGQVEIVLPTLDYLETLAGNAIIQGATQAQWWARQSGDVAWRFQTAVRQGLVAAETTPQIVRRVREVMDVSRRNAEALVRTSVQTVANDTREKLFNNHGDVIASKEWNAALDLRTCPTCGPRDGKRWTLDNTPIGHAIPYSVPPKHWRCRCSMVPVLKTWRELGININEMPDSTRASMEGQVSDKTFADWLARQNPGKIESVLGKGRADLWRNKTITLDQLLSNGEPLSLAELKAKYLSKK
jgi:SPP1 gp7 family putative phage head morphogenesis protein